MNRNFADIPRGVVFMPACPNCQNTEPLSLQYPEGVMYLCSKCRLQWAAIDKGEQAFIPSDNLHYLNPESLGNPLTYQPYCDFFSYLGRRFEKQSLRILDIGAGGGAFVQTCLALGHDPVGVEADTRLAMFMPPEVQARTHFGLAESIDFGDERFDVITFWDVFEHLESNFELLDRISSLLLPGGVVYLRVNNTHDLYNAVSQAMIKVVPPLGKIVQKSCFNFPSHCWNFSKESITSMLNRRGWRIEHSCIGETPSFRLTSNSLFRLAIETIYAVNRVIGGGKIGNYFLVKES